MRSGRAAGGLGHTPSSIVLDMLAEVAHVDNVDLLAGRAAERTRRFDWLANRSLGREPLPQLQAIAEARPAASAVSARLAAPATRSLPYVSPQAPAAHVEPRAAAGKLARAEPVGTCPLAAQPAHRLPVPRSDGSRLDSQRGNRSALPHREGDWPCPDPWRAGCIVVRPRLALHAGKDSSEGEYRSARGRMDPECRFCDPRNVRRTAPGEVA